MVSDERWSRHTPRGASARAWSVCLAVAVALGMWLPRGAAGQGQFQVAEGDYVLEVVSEKSAGDSLSEAQLNCITCETWLEAALADLLDDFDYNTLRSQMSVSCGAPGIRTYVNTYVVQRAFAHGYTATQRKQRSIDLRERCLSILNTVGDLAADLLWGNWDQWYYHGLATTKVCSIVANCGFTSAQETLPVGQVKTT